MPGDKYFVAPQHNFSLHCNIGLTGQSGMASPGLPKPEPNTY
jgi:hypothetical protein